MSVSRPSRIPSAQVDLGLGSGGAVRSGVGPAWMGGEAIAAQYPDELQRWLVQSASCVQALPAAHGPQLPPQSTAVSSPSRTPLKQCEAQPAGTSSTIRKGSVSGLRFMARLARGSGFWKGRSCRVRAAAPWWTPRRRSFTEARIAVMTTSTDPGEAVPTPLTLSPSPRLRTAESEREVESNQRSTASPYARNSIGPDAVALSVRQGPAHDHLHDAQVKLEAPVRH